MKIELGHERWRLVIDGDGNQETHDDVALDIVPIEKDTGDKTWGSRPNTDPSLIARQLQDGAFIGRIVLSELRFTEGGFTVQGLALEEEGSVYRDGIYLVQLWQADRTYQV